MIATVLVGLVVGLLARLLIPGRDPMGFIMTSILGIVGAALGGWFGRLLGFYRGDDPTGIVIAVIGAMLVLFIYRLLIPRLGTSRR
jgi:uncharacterized membrane protein YeaQ/YmgE (transglycosylase-associated protein family)